MASNSRTSREARRDDFALEHVPASFAAPGTASLFAVLLAIPTALVFFAVGGALQHTYGTGALLIGVVVASVVIGSAGWILTSFACRTGLDSDLISIKAGFGLKGSAVTSAIYTANFLMLFAIEAGIIAAAVHERFSSVPRSAALLVTAAVVLALAWRGVTGLTGIMIITLPLFVVLVSLAATEAQRRPAPQSSFWSDAPANVSLDATAWLTVLAVLLAFIVNATVAADIGRFLKPQRRRAGAFLFGGVLQIATFGGATLLGAWFAWRLGGATDPGGYLTELLGVAGVACVLLSQVRINLINAYSGSLSLTNFAARGLGLRHGRRTWTVAVVVGATVLALTDFSQHLLGVLTFEAVFVMAWVSTLVAYIAIADPTHSRVGAGLQLDSAPKYNFVGLSALAGSLAVATPLAFGVAGNLGKGLAPLVAMVAAPCGVVIALRLAGDKSPTAHPIS